MSAIETATQWLIDLANDDSHGYDQQYRWGEKGDYDCSSGIITAWENAGVPVKTNGATYTGNIRSVFLKCGFTDVTSKITLSTGAGLQVGDIPLNEANHVVQYIGNGQVVNISSNEKDTATGGQSGDQTGKEIRIQGYYDYPWDRVLRYTGDTITTNSNSSSSTTSGSSSTAEKAHTVKSGETLYQIAKSYGCTVAQLTEWNSIKNQNLISVGQVLTVSAPEGNFTVKVTTSNLNIRSGAGTSYASKGYCPVGAYTIIETKSADGYTWGKLKSGAGWIALEYTTRV